MEQKGGGREEKGSIREAGRGGGQKTGPARWARQLGQPTGPGRQPPGADGRPVNNLMAVISSSTAWGLRGLLGSV